MPTDTVENATTTTKAKRTISPEQQKASGLRRDAAILERMAEGSSDPNYMLSEAAKLRAQADALYPASVQGSTKQPALSEQEWSAIEGTVIEDIRGFLTKHISTKKLRAIANPGQ